MKYIVWLLILLFQLGISQKYYPTAIGNEWFFDSSSTTSRIKVTSDTTVANGKVYSILNRDDFAYGRYIRVDSHYVYHYFPKEEKEYPVFQLNGNRGDTTLSKYFTITIRSIDTTVVFNQISRNIHYRLEDFTQRDIVLSEIFGLIQAELYSDPPPPWPDFTYNAIGCTIDGNSYGFTLSANDEALAPNRFTLFQNYPNPFNPTTTISFSLPSTLSVTLKVFDLLGRERGTLFSGELGRGTYYREWNAKDFTSGVYFYSLQAGAVTITKKLMLIR